MKSVLPSINLQNTLHIAPSAQNLTIKLSSDVLSICAQLIKYQAVSAVPVIHVHLHVRYLGIVHKLCVMFVVVAVSKVIVALFKSNHVTALSVSCLGLIYLVVSVHVEASASVALSTSHSTVSLALTGKLFCISDGLATNVALVPHTSVPASYSAVVANSNLPATVSVPSGTHVVHISTHAQPILCCNVLVVVLRIIAQSHTAHKASLSVVVKGLTVNHTLDVFANVISL